MNKYAVKCTLKPGQGTGPIEVTNISDCEWRVQRDPAPNGELGMIAHEIDEILIERRGDGTDDPGSVIVKLAGARERNAYFSGEITLAPPKDATQIVRTLRWDKGHIACLRETVTAAGIVQRFDIVVTKLTVDDAEFLREIPRN